LCDRVAGSRPGPIGGHNNNSDVQFMQQIAGTTKDQGPALPVPKDKKSNARKGGGRVVDRCCGMCHVCGMLGPQTAQCHGLPFHCRATESLDTEPRPRSREETPASGNEALQATNGPSTTQGAIQCTGVVICGLGWAQWGARWPHVRALCSVPAFGGFLGVCLPSGGLLFLESRRRGTVR